MSTAIDLNSHEVHGLCKNYYRNEQLHPSFNSINNECNIQVLNYRFEAISKNPAGFLGCHRLLNVEVLIRQNDGSDSVEHLQFFAKSAPQGIDSHMEYIEEFGVFKKEIAVYRDVLPNLQKIFVNFAPICYHADRNALVFENLGQQGFRMAAERDGLLNYEHLQCVLKTLAEMQASSIVYEKQMGKSLKDLHPEAIKENAYPLNIPENHVRRQNFRNAVLVMMEIIKGLPKYKQNLNEILDKVPNRMERIFELSKTSERYVNVFTHGDLWANNVMFQYTKFGEIPIQCRLVDFQLARYAPPMMDVLTILTIPTTRAFRQKYLLELLHEYYMFLTAFLKRKGISIENIFPKPEFEACTEEFRICGLIESILFSHLTILPTELTSKLTASTNGFSDFFGNTRIEFCMQAYKTDVIYRERLTDMIEDFVDNFVL